MTTISDSDLETIANGNDDMSAALASIALATGDESAAEAAERTAATIRLTREYYRGRHSGGGYRYRAIDVASRTVVVGSYDEADFLARVASIPGHDGHVYTFRAEDLEVGERERESESDDQHATGERDLANYRAADAERIAAGLEPLHTEYAPQDPDDLSPEDRRVADRIADLPLVEPAPGYEERAVERARDAGILGTGARRRAP